MHVLPFLVAMAALAQSVRAQWPVPASSAAAYEYVQSRREAAGKLWTAKDPKGIDLLHDALRYLNQPLVRELAVANTELAARQLNVLLDLAQAMALLGRDSEALDALRQAAERWPLPELAQFMESREAFAQLRSNPEYQATLRSFRRFERFWESPALGGAFKSQLTEAERVAGLSKLWAEIKFNYAFPERLIAIGWDQLYLDSLPRVVAAHSTGDYYKELMLLCAKVRDGHTNVYPPKELDWSAKPPLRTALIEGRVMITDVLSPALTELGFRAGVEITKVDGEAAVSYARREIEPYQSSATPQDLEVRTFDYGFLRGPGKRAVRLTLVNPDGRETEHSVARSGYGEVRQIPDFEWTMLPSQIAWVKLNSFASSRTVKQFIEAFEEIRAAKAVILDLRRNGGGDSRVGFEVLRYFIEQPARGSRSLLRRYRGIDRARGMAINWDEAGSSVIDPAPGPRFRGHAVVLSGAATFSAAEDFLVAWRNARRGPIIGARSAGSTGQPLLFALPGGGSARVCTKQDTFPDGSQWVGLGIAPDIEVIQRHSHSINGADAVLDRAIVHLTSAR